MPRRFEFVDAGSSKFWEVEQSGASVTTWWGRIGTDGQSKTKDFGSEAEAKSEYVKIIAEKTKKGYVEVGSTSATVAKASAAATSHASAQSASVAETPKSAPPAGVAVLTLDERRAQLIPKAAVDSTQPAAVATEPAAKTQTKAKPSTTPPKQAATVGDEELTKLLKDFEQEVAQFSSKQDPSVAWFLRPNVEISNLASVDRIFKLPLEQQAAVFAWALGLLKPGVPTTPDFCEALQQIATKLCKRKLPLNESQLVVVVQTTGHDFPNTYIPAATVLTMVEEFMANESDCEQLKAAMVEFQTAIANSYDFNSAAQKLLHRVNILLEKAETGEEPIPIAPAEAWSDQAIADLKALDGEARQAWLRLIDHCSTCSGTTPSNTWSKKSGEFVKAVGEENFITHLSRWFALVPKKGSRTGEEPGGWGVDSADVIRPQNADILKGLAFACTGRTDARLATALGDAAETSFKKVTGLGPRCPKLGTACVHALSSMNTKESIAQLTRVQARAKHASVKVQINKALDNAATKSGMSVDDLQDIGVPDFGMQEVGKLTLNLGDWTAQLTIEDTDTIATSFISPSGKAQQNAPSEIKTEHADKLKELKKIEKDLEKLLPGLRNRIERSYIEQRHWNFAQWRERYVDHPVTGTMARRLLWNFNGRAGIWYEGKFVDQAGAELTPEDAALVELWHPIGAEPAVVLQWRRWLAEHKIVQPFKQCHREIYVVTDAEVQTGDYSNRFAGHILKQHQLQHLCLQRGWQYQLMGSFDCQSTPTLHLPRWNLIVELYVDTPADRDEIGIFTTVASDKVLFLRRGEGEARNRASGVVSIRELMPVVFSEVMRDVDLFISVCSIGTDPNWTEGYGEYWTKFSFGDLSHSAETRKQVLADILPHLRIASRCHLDGKFLVVKGDVRTYKIHIGSGNIMMEPNDQYLCIVAARGLAHTAEKVFLPFEGDNILSLILSKAVMLADDTKIKDETILSQIRR